MTDISGGQLIAKESRTQPVRRVWQYLQLFDLLQQRLQ